VVTVGIFDGVHLGHQRLIQTTVRWAKRLQATSVAITFHPDPQQVLAPHTAPLPLMPLEARVRCLSDLGVELVWVIPFTRGFAKTSAGKFVRTMLFKRLRTCCVIVGETFAFGKDRRGSVDLLQTLGRELGIRVVLQRPVYRDGQSISSSRIRRTIQHGNLAQAQRLLGRPVELWGTVVAGQGRARTMGFPTANIRVTGQLLPPRGVYQVWLDHAGRRYQGLMNVGTRPTFGGGPITCEVHLMGFHGNLYNQAVRVVLLRQLRAERRFRSQHALAQQIHRDLAAVHLVASPRR